MADTPDSAVVLRTLRDGHTVQVIAVDDLRVGDRMRFGGTTRGLYYAVDALAEKPKTREVTIRIGAWEGTEAIRLRRRRTVFIVPRRVYEASVVVRDERTETDLVIDSFLATTPEEARAILAREFAAHQGPPIHGTIVAGETTDDHGERHFVADPGADYVRVDPEHVDDTDG
jgi:hypothetical protein